ncbi:MAG: hypothetical protein PHY08_13550 [Candidatus Cloacimonetes bacterium]|nr:hypothetical protein [Candidatus Cloacimonadota bacterium]
MKKILIFIFIILMILSSCSSKIDIPEGVSDKHFYQDMIKCLDNVKLTLEKKNVKYINDINNIQEKYTANDEKYFSFTDKEKEIFTSIGTTKYFLTMYMEEYFEGHYNSKIFIDDKILYADLLIRQIQETIGLMEIEYDFDF